MSGPLKAMIEERGFVVLYRPAETNHCPGCGGTQWHVGRASAECAWCDTAIDLAAPREGANTPFTTVSKEN